MQAKFLLCAFLAAGLHSQAQNGSPYWSLSANNNTTPASRLGTTNAMPLYLTTNNASRIYIAPNGNVGIGTTTPASLFNVQGPTLLSIFTSTDALGPTSGSGIIGYTRFMPTAAGQRLGYFLTGSQNNGVDPGNGTGMVGYSDGAWSSTSRPSSLAFETAKSGSRTRSEAMRITSNGNVGIGTKNPQYRLHVVDSFSTAIYAEALGTNTYGIYGQGSVDGVTGVGAKHGVFGSGVYGVYGSGSGYGVYGEGNSYGLYGISGSAGTGVFGSGTTGVYGQSVASAGDGIRGNASGTESYGGNFSSTKAYGIYATTSNFNSYAGYFSGSVYTSGVYTSSDKKLKKNITDFTDALSIIDKLKPKTYEFQNEGRMAEMNLSKGKHFGLIAQDLETVLPNLVKETLQYPHHSTDSSGKTGISSASNTDQQTFKAVNYTELIPIVIKALQEEHAQKEQLSQEVQTLKETVAELKAMLANNTTGSLSMALLEVPIPNPAKGSTNIRYSVPAGTASVRLTVVNMLGQVMKDVKLNAGSGQVNLNVSNLAAGTYPCTLWVNGTQAISKQLVVAH